MYHLFTGQNYYPESGLGDYTNSFEELEEAENMGRQLTRDGGMWRDDWWVVVTEVDGRLTTVSRGYTGSDD